MRLITALLTSLVAARLGVTQAAPLANQSYPLTHEPGSVPYNKLEPLQQRIAYKDAWSMSISWNTYAQLNDSVATVVYGSDPMNLDQTAYAKSRTFPTSRTWSHHAQLTGLTPKTTYHYRVAYTNCFACSYIETYTFTTPREAGCDDSYTIAVVADMGLMGSDGLTDVTGDDAKGALRSDETNVMQSMVQNIDAYESIVHVGDLAYADYFIKAAKGNFYPGNGTARAENATEVVAQYEYLNEQFYDELTCLTAHRPYMVAVGNHESNCANSNSSICMPGQTNFTAYADHWNMPGAADATQNFWYSYDNGLVHYIILDFETDFGEGIFAPDEVGGTGKNMSPPRGIYRNQQIDWLKADLAAIDRSKTPWVLVFGHRPFYVASAACEPCQQAFEQIMIENNVDIMFNGHDHIYSVSLPVANFTADPNGYDNPSAPMYITNGVGGHYDGLDVLDDPMPDYIDYGLAGTYGWSLVHIHNRTHLTQDFVRAADSKVIHSVTLYKEHHY